MTVFDGFTFFNELDLLEIRLQQMSHYVDAFVLVEAPVTFRGDPKPLHYHANRDRFAAFADKIRHIVVGDMPASPDPWVRERHQRDCIRRGLQDAAPGDVVMISDVDEIIDAHAVQEAAARAQFCFLTQDLFYFHVNWRVADLASRLWTKAYVAPAATIAAIPSLSEPREHDALDVLARLGLDPVRSIIDAAGWHFSWTGGPAGLVTKMNAFSHSEAAMQRWNDPALLAAAIGDQRFFYDGTVLDNLRLSHGFPDPLMRHADRYRRAGLVSANEAEGAIATDMPRLLLQRQIARHEAALSQEDALQDQLRAIRDSRSWRLTAPARHAAALARRAFGRGQQPSVAEKL